MTTDVAEETQLEGQETPASTVTEPDASSPEDIVRFLEEFERDETQDGEAQNPEGEKPSQETEPEADEELTAAIEAERKAAAEEAVERTREEERTRIADENRIAETRRQLDGIETAFKERASSLRNVLAKALNGEDVLTRSGQPMTPEQIVNWAVNELNAHHAQAAPVTASQYWGFMDAQVGELPDDVAAPLKAKRQSGQYHDFPAYYADVKSAIEKAATKDRPTAAQLDAAKATAKVEIIRRFQTDEAYRNRILNRAQRIDSRSPGAPVSGGNPDAVLEDPSASREAQAAAFERKHGFKPE